MFLVDTSVWIDLLRNRATPQVELLEALLEDGSAFICEVVFIEICAGAQGTSQLRKYRNYFGKLPQVRLKQDWEHRVSEMMFQTKKAGKTIYLADAIIGSLALENDLALLTTDKDFFVLRDLFNLRLHMPSG